MIGRYELKFPVTAEQKQLVLAQARHALRPDIHGAGASYRISSMYFDTEDLSAYWEKLDGEEVRRKYRLRYYSVDESPSARARDAFMEIKHRIANVLFKERVRLTDDGANAILQDPRQLTKLSTHVYKQQDHRSPIAHIQRVATECNLIGANVISYLREAWEGTVDHRLRLTFDTKCHVYPPPCYLDVTSDRGIPLVSANAIIMEIKFDHAIPRWLRDIVSQLGLQLERISKYSTGINVSGRYDHFLRGPRPRTNAR